MLELQRLGRHRKYATGGAVNLQTVKLVRSRAGPSRDSRRPRQRAARSAGSDLPHAERAVLGYQLEHAHHLQAEGVASPPPPHVLLLPVDGLPDVQHQLLEQVLEGLHVDPAQGLHRGVPHVGGLAAQQGHDQLVQAAGGHPGGRLAAGGGLVVATLVCQAVRGRAAEETTKYAHVDF